jgi:hypothetical protein
MSEYAGKTRTRACKIQLLLPTRPHVGAHRLHQLTGFRTLISEHDQLRNTDIHAGMGIVADREEAYSFKSDSGAILVILEAEQLQAHERGISTPQRIAGATWSGDIYLKPKA